MPSILVVEDEEQLRSMLRMVLGHAGYEVQEAGNGKEALEIQSTHPADVIITDIIMPDKEGLDTIRELRRSYPDVRIIAMSGGGRIGAADYLDVAKKMGADYTLIKPFSSRDVLDGIQLMLRP